MSSFPRQLEPELMDDPAVPPAEHAAALRGLARLNRWSRSARSLWPPLRDLARERRVRTLRLLDVATGCADVPIQLFQLAARDGIELDITACDRSPSALRIAREHADAAGVSIQFVTCDAVAAPLQRHADGGRFDAVISSLFLHHLAADDGRQLLRHLADASDDLVLINDLERTRTGLATVYLASRLVSRSRIVRVDGPRSVRAAYTIAEAERLAEDAGLHGARATRRGPCRFVLVWRRP